ncbi:hypothetical protein M0802_001519 [Mischocyttarus mexicanus]|nr:hypothetical protein M0802_001519 [Mischocyttarus mexicanus]
MSDDVGDRGNSEQQCCSVDEEIGSLPCSGFQSNGLGSSPEGRNQDEGGRLTGRMVAMLAVVILLAEVGSLGDENSISAIGVVPVYGPAIERG